MDKLTFIEVETMFGTETHAIIEHADGSFTSMLKSTYDTLASESPAALEAPTE